ncbi:MAG: hypothetical protein ACOC56_02320 [Atribacterota bacterium]
MKCIKTWRDCNTGNVKGLFTCDCKKFQEKSPKFEDIIEQHFKHCRMM